MQSYNRVASFSVWADNFDSQSETQETGLIHLAADLFP